jgi:ATP sulfurylase
MHDVVEHTANLISPYAGMLMNQPDGRDECIEWMDNTNQSPLFQLSPRSVCDFEFLAMEASSPLDRFLRQTDYPQASEEIRRTDGLAFPFPINLVIHTLNRFAVGREVALRTLNWAHEAMEYSLLQPGSLP